MSQAHTLPPALPAALPAIPVVSLSRRLAPLQSRLQAAAAEVIAGGHYVLGERVERFEREFADYCGVAHAIGVGNGTDALEIALKAVGVTHGDRVVLAANAAMYGTTAVLACGAMPVYADILPGEATLDPEAVAQLMRTHAPRAVLATHLYGRLARVDALRALADRHGAALVEDCAQAHGAQSADGRRAGSFGDAAAFSFYPTKNLGALGDGGAVLCRDPGIATRARSLRQYGWEGKYRNLLPGGRNSRLDSLQAALLSVLLPELDGWNAARRVVAARYRAGIVHARITLPPAADTPGEDVAHLFVVRCPQREALRAHLLAQGIQTEVHYPLPDHLQPCMTAIPGGAIPGGDGERRIPALPQTERDAAEVLSLPCFPDMTDAEIERVIAACSRF